jgi:hypothetical protein
LEEKAGIAQKAFALIKWVDSWKKLGILMVLVSFFSTGYFAWEHRRELSFWAMASFGTPQIDESTIEGESSRLMADTGAISVTVWAVNLEQNRRASLYVRMGEGRRQSLEGVGDLALRPHSEHSANLINAISNKTQCSKAIANTAVGEEARKRGVVYTCSAAIPPSHGAMIGLLVVGFTELPKNEDYIKLRMREAAQAMIK